MKVQGRHTIGLDQDAGSSRWIQVETAGFHDRREEKQAGNLGF